MEAALQMPQHKIPHYQPCLFDTRYADDHPQTAPSLPVDNPYEGLRVSEDDYWLYFYEYSDLALEWNNGVLEEKPVSDKDSYDMYTWFHRLITQYVERFDEGSMIGLEIGFRLKVGNKVSIRKPDLAFIHKKNPVQMYPLERSYKGCFDICFEFLSDSTIKEVERDTVVKKHEYESYGVREYYILDRLGDETAFYYLNAKGQYQSLKPNRYGIVKSKVLKHFQFRVDDLYNRPSDMQLVRDRVYQKYVMVDYQKEHNKAVEADKKAKAEEKRADEANKIAEAERKKVKKERQKTEKERKKVEKERKKVEKLANVLAKMGITVEEALKM